MNTAEQQTQAQDEAKHQQGEAKPDGCLCLHCRLLQTHDKWVEDWAAAHGGVNPLVMGHHVGAFVAEMALLVEMHPDATPEVVAAWEQAFLNGQAQVRADAAKPEGSGSIH